MSETQYVYILGALYVPKDSYTMYGLYTSLAAAKSYFIPEVDDEWVEEDTDQLWRYYSSESWTWVIEKYPLLTGGQS